MESLRAHNTQSLSVFRQLGAGGGDRVPNGSPTTRPLCLQRPPHIVLIVLEENPTSSTSHCCPVQTANKRGPEGQRSWQTLLTIPCSKTNIVPSSQHLNNRQKSNISTHPFPSEKKPPSVGQNKWAGRQTEHPPAHVAAVHVCTRSH